MTTATLIESLKPGELVVRCADGSLLRTMTSDFRVAHERRSASVRKLMRKLAAVKQRNKK